MKFRSGNAGAEAQSNTTATAQEIWEAEENLSSDWQEVAKESVRGPWSTAFLMAGSALAGATALALWNRRTIATMRNQMRAGSEARVPASQPEEEIF